MPHVIVRPDTLTAWMGPSLLVVAPDGECGPHEGLSGYYFREARFLRTLRLTVDGERPWRCEGASLSPAILSFVYVYPEIAEFGGGGSGSSGDETPTNPRGIPQRALAIQTTCTVECNGLSLDVRVTNHAPSTVSCELAFDLDADFADIQEALSGRREQEGSIRRDTNDLGVVFTYGHDQLRYRSTIQVTSHRDWRIGESRIATTITLPPQEGVDLGIRVTPSAADGSPLAIDAEARQRAIGAWTKSFVSISIPRNRIAEQIITENIADFASFPLLEGAPDEWLALQAGMPLYPALFGRDTLTAGWGAAWVDQGASLDASLSRLAHLQTERTDD